MVNEIRLFNTLTGNKEDLVPIEDKKIGIYVCGPTVYDSPHLGHARAAVMFDVMTRFLKLIGYDVTYVRNYTDVDDKIINKSTETGIRWSPLVSGLQITNQRSPNTYLK
jgi:cysteinyl-tRNA synthetase